MEMGKKNKKSRKKPASVYKNKLHDCYVTLSPLEIETLARNVATVATEAATDPLEALMIALEDLIEATDSKAHLYTIDHTDDEDGRAFDCCSEGCDDWPCAHYRAVHVLDPWLNDE
jgi:hypothetical protein